MRLISAAEIPALLPMEAAITLMREAFCLISDGQVSVAERQAVELPNGTGLLMGAGLESKGIAAKLVSVMPGNMQLGLPGSIGLVLLMDAQDGSPLALMDGTCLTAIRTAALNAVAIDLLANQSAKTALIVGTGTQARAQLQALCMVRDLTDIRVMGRRESASETFVESMQGLVGPHLSVSMDSATACSSVDIIIAATNSSEPVIPGYLIPDGCHVSGIGSFKRGMCEFDHEFLSKSSIFVEHRETAIIEAGELISATEAGIIKIHHWTEIGEVLGNQRPGRTSETEITFFKSVGHAVFDLVAARAIWDAAIEQDIGQEWHP
ncbi:MAG: ornithine cyclodeaminase/alanine dehydrogenase-like protein (mu-crystallin family) [Rhodothermales bacterium]|jgi:ornithine cyclodeaminase/alanine dehydrogenase-like protein (mu-crystallin family)